jgi:prolyl 4-hydroxylase
MLAKMNHMLGIPLEQMEEPQIVRYQKGQEFSWHYDEVPAAQLANGGQRLATLLVYLNTVQSGGGTIFRDLKDRDGNPLTMKPVQGSALLFFPADATGKPDDRTLHKGEVVTLNDEKWIIQMWIHERQYRAAVPRGNSQQAALEAVNQASLDLGYL